MSTSTSDSRTRYARTASPVLSVYQGHEIRAYFSMEAKKKVVLPLLSSIVEEAVSARIVIDYVVFTPDGYVVVVPKWVGGVRFPIIKKLSQKLVDTIDALPNVPPEET